MASCSGEQHTHREKLSSHSVKNLVKEKEDLELKIAVQKEKNRRLKQEMEKDYLDYSEQVKIAEDEVSRLKDNYL